MPQNRRPCALIRRLTSVIAALLLALPAAAWNYSGHRIIAEIAYERLTPQARARVDRDDPRASGLQPHLHARSNRRDQGRSRRACPLCLRSRGPLAGQISTATTASMTSWLRMPSRLRFCPAFPDMMRHPRLALFRHRDFGGRHARDRTAASSSDDRASAFAGRNRDRRFAAGRLRSALAGAPGRRCASAAASHQPVPEIPAQRRRGRKLCVRRAGPKPAFAVGRRGRSARSELR